MKTYPVHTPYRASRNFLEKCKNEIFNNVPSETLKMYFDYVRNLHKTDALARPLSIKQCIQHGKHIEIVALARPLSVKLNLCSKKRCSESTFLDKNAFSDDVGTGFGPENHRAKR